MYKNPFKSLTRFEWALYILSVSTVTASFIFSQASGILTMVASLIGATALIFVSKGDVLGQILTVIFSIIYGVISFSFSYYGEMITYLGMTAPIAVMSIITWLRHPYEKGRRQVEIAKVSRTKSAALFLLTALVTFAFYFILKYFATTNLVFSTISVATSFLASSLMMLRSPYYALAYSSNDIVLIILWILATIENISYLPMIACFVIFLFNDLYGFFNWKRMMKIQNTLNRENY